MKRLFHIGRIATMLGLATWSHAQAIPTASRAGALQLGAGWSVANPDYGPSKTQGISIFGDLDLTRHLGIEGDIHRASTITPTDIGVDSYLLGPRYIVRHGRFKPYAKALFGLGRFKYQYDTSPHTAYTYKMFAFGGGLDIRTTRHVTVRAIDFEYQRWPGYPPNGLTPIVYTFGAAYAF